jgi:hypothetical protein
MVTDWCTAASGGLGRETQVTVVGLAKCVRGC